ncbi:MAG: XamI family restriction endonuclease [Cypionkella sp.]|nr:XamI family restriction endonuclease [Cypionkella sp.]
MPLNADKPDRWKADVERSIDFYNEWFLRFAPETYRKQRQLRTAEVAAAFTQTQNLRGHNSGHTQASTLRCCPCCAWRQRRSLARDRLMGLAYVTRSLIGSMEGKGRGAAVKSLRRMDAKELGAQLKRICDVLTELLDRDLFPWIDASSNPTPEATSRAAMVVADRLCGAATDPILRNAQERRQLEAMSRWLKKRGYREVKSDTVDSFEKMQPGTYAFRLNVPVGKTAARINLPIDCVIQPHGSKAGGFPVLIEAKAAGDATNTNKRRKEEA